MLYCSCIIFQHEMLLLLVFLDLISHRRQPSRNRAGNPAFWLISRIFARKSRIVIFDSKLRLFRLRTSSPSDIHLVRVSQGVRW